MVRLGAPPVLLVAVSPRIRTLRRRRASAWAGAALLAGAFVACGDAAIHAIGISPAEGGIAEGGPAESGPGEGGPVEGGLGLPGANLAVYWGQDLFGGANPDAGTLWEQPLADACAGTPYDFVILAYVSNVANGGDGTPASFYQDFADHCPAGTPLAGAPGLSQCEDIAAGIAACHQAGKKVLIGLGEGDLGLESDTDGGVGAQAAESMWDLYLGGPGSIRPFPGQTLDGVDLAFEIAATVPSPGYVRFASRLRELMNASGSTYYLTASPRCEYPDPSLGPGMGTTLGDNVGVFDALFVQFFYESPCDYSTADASAFHASFESWATLERNGRPKIFVGLWLAPDGLGYVDRASLSMLVSDVKNSPAFGGVVLRDESYDQNSKGDSGTTYGQYARSLLQ